MRRLIVVPLTVIATTLFTALFALPATPALAGTGAHAAITISSNADFSACGCVTSGDGTAANPFVIGPWAISAPSGGTSGWSVKVDNSRGRITDYFNVFGISSAYNDTNTTDPAIWLVNIHTATTISGNNAHPTGGNNLGIGVELDNSSNIGIDGVDYNKGNGIGVFVNGSSNVSINNSKLKATCNLCSPHTGDGIYAVNSAILQIGPMSPTTMASASTCRTPTTWSSTRSPQTRTTPAATSSTVPAPTTSLWRTARPKEPARSASHSTARGSTPATSPTCREDCT